MADPDYFTIAELRARPDMGSDTRFPEDEVLREAAAVTRSLENEVGTSFIPRERTEELDGDGGLVLLLARPFVREITDCTVDGVTVDPTDLIVRGPKVRYRSGARWSRGIGNIAIEYTTGYTATPPDDIKTAVMDGTRWRLLAKEPSSADDPRRISMTSDLGTIQLAVAGPDRPTGYPDVDAVIIAWRDDLVFADRTE